MIVLITPTGSRQAQFDLCSRWMSQQTYSGNVLWIIVDDCYPRTTNKITETFKTNWIIEKVYPAPVWSGANTQGRNMKAGIDKLIKHNLKDVEGIFIIEDDDYYRPVYLERMMVNFGSYSLIGERNTIYYNVVYRRWVTNPNTKHASLFQTAFTVDVIPYFQKCYSQKFMDATLWDITPNKMLFYENDLAIGIKGMPGRGGIGAGHSKAFTMQQDINMIFLRSKIGEDAKQYEGYYGNHRVSQHDILSGRRR
jgi:hypothetical protein